jgi:hypothetical protein
MSYGTLRLEPDGDWDIDRNVISVREGSGVTVWRLPRGRAKVSLRKIGKGRARLIVGGFASIAVEVVGPVADLEKLMGEL